MEQAGFLKQNSNKCDMIITATKALTKTTQLLPHHQYLHCPPSHISTTLGQFSRATYINSTQIITKLLFSTWKTCFWPSLSFSATQTLVRAFITSRLNYCNSINYVTLSIVYMCSLTHSLFNLVDNSRMPKWTFESRRRENKAQCKFHVENNPNNNDNKTIYNNNLKNYKTSNNNFSSLCWAGFALLVEQRSKHLSESISVGIKMSMIGSCLADTTRR